MEITILDGPLGTQLAARGIPTPPPAWSAQALRLAPDVVCNIHRAYAAAGATVHTANTFRTRPGDVGSDWPELARLAVELAREGAGGGRVAGSIAPIADCYRPDQSPGREGKPQHRALAEVLADAGVDLLLCETFPHVEEALAAVEAAVDTGLETWLALTAGPYADLLTPEALAEGARAAVDRGAAAILVNCVPATRTLAFLERLVGLGVPIGAYANAGAFHERIGWATDEDHGAERFLELAQSWVDVGATIVGGCCGTGPTHIRALANAFTSS